MTSNGCQHYHQHLHHHLLKLFEDLLFVDVTLTCIRVYGVLDVESWIVVRTIAVEPQKNLTTVIDVRAEGTVGATISSRNIVRVV